MPCDDALADNARLHATISGYADMRMLLDIAKTYDADSPSTRYDRLKESRIL